MSGHRLHDAFMRTTLTLDPDIAAKARKGAARLRKPFKEVINAALRVGLMKSSIHHRRNHTGRKLDHSDCARALNTTTLVNFSRGLKEKATRDSR